MSNCLLFTLGSIFILFLPIWAEAQINSNHKSMFKLEPTMGSTSDNIEYSRLNLGLDSHRSNPYWRYSDEPKSFKGYSLEYSSWELDRVFDQFKAQHLKIGGVVRREEWQFFGMLGIQSLSGSELFEDSSNTMAGAGLHLFHLNYHWELSLERGLIHHKVMPLAGEPKDLLANSITNRLNIDGLDGKEKWQVQLQNSISNTEDKNQRKWTDLQVLNKILVFPIWLRVGVGAELIYFSETSPNYWSPNKFYSMGLRFDFSYPILDKVNFDFGGSLNRLKEEDFKPGSGYFLSGGLSIGDRENSQIKVFVQENKSEQLGQVWQSHFVGVSFNQSW